MDENNKSVQEVFEKTHALAHALLDLSLIHICQMNAHDSETIAGMLEQMGMTEAAAREDADFVLRCV